jgi:hypothetical protein
MHAMKNRIWMFLLALAMISVGCNEQNSTNSDTQTEQSGNQIGKEATEQGEALGNAQDENMPNTMATAAGLVTKTNLSGKINGKIEASLELYQTGDVIRGSITYKTSGKPILVLGTEGENGTIFLREFLPDGKITGGMSGEFDGEKFSGSWYGNDKDLKLEMNVTNQMEDVEWPFDVNGSVAGEYAYHYPAESTGDPGAAGTLKVKQSGNKVTFSFDCINGPPAYSIATIEDTEGILNGNTVEAKLPDLDCAFTIRLFKGFAMVHQKNGYIDCGFGNGAGIEGEYIKVR